MENETITLEKALDRLSESRRLLELAIEGLGQEAMTQVKVEGEWTIRDILGHVAAWEKVLLEPLRRYTAGGPFAVEVIEDFMAWNDVQAARRRDVPLEAIVEEMVAVRRDLLKAANRLSADQRAEILPFPWGQEGTMAEALDGLHWHEMEHVEHIQAWRKRET